jgi:periplasmic protein TonB
MSADELTPRNQRENTTSAALSSYQDEPGGWASGELIRLFVVPAMVAVIFAGGVYWIRLRLPAASAGQPSTSIVQVHLLPRPDAAPIAMASVPHSNMENVVSRAEASLEKPEPTISDDPLPTPKAFSPGDAPPSNVMSAPSAMSGPADEVAAKFQQALLRHVARYQHYPNAARSLHLEGKVDTQFSMASDGTLLGVWVRTSSGQAVLDKEAIETIRRSQPLPPIPQELPERLNVRVQLEFDPS